MPGETAGPPRGRVGVLSVLSDALQTEQLDWDKVVIPTSTWKECLRVNSHRHDVVRPDAGEITSVVRDKLANGGPDLRMPKNVVGIFANRG